MYIILSSGEQRPKGIRRKRITKRVRERMTTSVSGCGSVSLITNRSAFFGSGLQHRAVSLKPWSSSSLQSRSMVVESKTKTSSEDRTARHSRIRKKVLFLRFEFHSILARLIALSSLEFSVVEISMEIGVIFQI